MPSHEVPEENPYLHDEIQLPEKKQDGGNSQLVFNYGDISPTQLEEDNDDFGVWRGSRAYYAATMGFHLPSLNLTKDEGSLLDSLFLFASGETSSGVIRIVTKEQNETTTDTRIQVKLVARFWNTEVLGSHTSVCAMRRGRELGIALLVSAIVGHSQRLILTRYFYREERNWRMYDKFCGWTQRSLYLCDLVRATEIIISTQAQIEHSCISGQTLDLDHLTSDVPSFKLVVGLEDKVRFRSARLHSGDAPVTINVSS